MNSEKAPDSRFTIHPKTGCWIWQLAPKSNGYGRIAIPGRRQALVHRHFYEALVGPIPPGFVIDHLCRTKMCVNPAHMEAVPQAVNVWRGRLPKLTPDQVAEIRALRAEGHTCRALAARFGVGCGHISHLGRGRSWVGAAELYSHHLDFRGAL